MTDRTFTRSQGYNERDLLNFAFDHLASSRILFESSPSCHDSAAALGHLAVEQLMKAALLYCQDEFPGTHDLLLLKRLLLEAKPHQHSVLFTEEGSAILERINELVWIRYPHPSGSPEIGSDDWPPLKALALALVRILPEEIGREFRTSLEKGGRVLMQKYVGVGAGAGEVTTHNAHEDFNVRRERLEAARVLMMTAYDRALLTLSGGAFSLSILFWKEIATSPTPFSRIFLLSGWTLFGLSLVVTIASFLVSERAHARELDDLDRAVGTKVLVPGGHLEGVLLFMSRAAGALFCAGLLMMLVFAAMNLYGGEQL